MANSFMKLHFVRPDWYKAAPLSTLPSSLHACSHDLHTKLAATKLDGPTLPARMIATRSTSETTASTTARVRSAFKTEGAYGGARHAQVSFESIHSDCRDPTHFLQAYTPSSATS
eukprot:5150305-Prymnesium_polylepis.2